MARFLMYICAALLCLGAYELPLFGDTSGEMTDAELSTYYADLKQQIDKQNATVQNMMQTIKNRTQIFSDANRAEMEQAIVTLDVKRTLYANFYGKESVKKSAAIRAKLLAVLSQPEISEADLASLQSLVQQEKTRYNIR